MKLLLSILEGFNLCPLNVGLCFITTKKVKLHFLQENDKGPSLKPNVVSTLGGFDLNFVNLVLMNLLLSILGGFNLCQLNVGSCCITTKKAKLHFLQ